MESKKFFFYGVLLFLVSMLGAHEYYVVQTDGETRFMQRLAWQADDNASRYEIVIEELIKGDASRDGLLASDESLESDDLLASEESLESDEFLASGESLEGKELPEGEEFLESDETSGADTTEDPETAGTVETAGTTGTVEVAETAGTTGTAEVAGTAGTVGTVETESEEALEKSEPYTEVLREFADVAYIEVSLPPGIYRYQVTAYDFLDRPGAASEWARLTILEALDPTVRDFNPRVFYVDGNAPWALNLTGRNISPDAKVYLESENNRVIVPREFTSDDSLSGAQLVFDVRQLVPGNYEIHIENPGGLNTSAGTFEIGFFRSYDIFIGAAYTPLVPLYGEFGQLEKKPIYPLGAAVRFGIFPIKKTFGYFGAELSAVWNNLSSDSGENELSYHVIGAEVNLLYQKWLSSRVTAFTIRAGGGVAVATDILLPRATIGASFLWLILKPLYLEAGIDGMHWFADGNPGYLRPWLGAGVKL